MELAVLEFDIENQGDRSTVPTNVPADTTVDDLDNILKDVPSSEEDKQRTWEPSRRVQKNHPTANVSGGRDE